MTMPPRQQLPAGTAAALALLALAGTAAAAGECRFEAGTAYEEPAAGDTWELQMSVTSAGECCGRCRGIPECFVGNYMGPKEFNGTGDPTLSLEATCWMRGQVDLSKPTRKDNVTACVVGTRPAPIVASPAGAKNVLYMVSDDCRPELPNYGQDYIQAPNLAKLAARGLTFMHAYCQQSICSPSRNSFMSGHRPQVTKTWNFVNDFRQELPFVMSFPQYFKHHNYTVLGHSKLYHPGHPQNYDEPLSWSQDNPQTLNPNPPGDVPKKHQPGSYFYPGDGQDEDHPSGNPAYPLPHQPSGCGYFDVCPSNLSRAHFMDYTTATKAIDTMGMMVAKKKPFFMGVGLIRPHLPFVVPLDMWAKYGNADIKQPGSALPPVGYVNISLNDQIFAGNKTFCPDGTDPNATCPSVERRAIVTSDDTTPFHPETPATTRFLRHGYYAAVSFMDEQVGRLVDRVEELGKTDETIMIFHGDHGWHLGEQGLWTKKTVFELGARVPLIIAAPHITASHGHTTLHLAELVDVYPTVAALAGLPPPPDLVHRAANEVGISLMPAFLDPTKPGQAKDYAFSEFPQCPGIHRVRGGPPVGGPGNLWHTNAGCQSTFRENIGFFGFSIRSLSYRYTEWHPWDGDKLQADWTTMTGVELYDYRTVDMTDFDQFDRVNVAGQAGHDSAQKELATALHAHFNNM